jgi:predicted GNAT family acetyltransferase
MSVMVRALKHADEGMVERFLVEHRDSSMFLRSSIRGGALGKAAYAGGFRDGRLVGVVAHGSNGMVVLQAPEVVAELAGACVSWSGRRISGLSGPLDQVRKARTALELDEAATIRAGEEGLYAVDLSDLVIPESLSSGAVACREPEPSERDALCDWRLAYDLEAVGASDTPEQRTRASAYLDAQIAKRNVWVAAENGVPVSLAGFNAVLPDMVQVGGVYTPPALRGHGFAKAAVGGALLAARERGASRAVLFTDNPSAVRTYGALGFVRVGAYSVVLFR